MSHGMHIKPAADLLTIFHMPLFVDEVSMKLTEAAHSLPYSTAKQDQHMQ
jgi:hypothetical protein